MMVYRENNHAVVPLTGDPQPVLDRYLKKAGVKLAEI